MGTVAFALGRQPADIWVADWPGAMARLTTSNSHSQTPWTPDGRRIAFASQRRATGRLTFNLYWQRADGSGDRRLTTSDNQQAWLVASEREGPRL